MGAEIILLESFKYPEAIFQGLCKQILAGPANKIVTPAGIKGFLDGLCNDGYFSDTIGGNVIIGKGATRWWCHFVRQWMKVAYCQAAVATPLDSMGVGAVVKWVTRHGLARVG